MITESKSRSKIYKAEIYQQFCKIMVNEPSFAPALENLKEWLKETDMQYNKNIGSEDFYKYNKYLGLKIKKPEKLNAPEKKLLELD